MPPRNRIEHKRRTELHLSESHYRPGVVASVRISCQRHGLHSWLVDEAGALVPPREGFAFPDLASAVAAASRAALAAGCDGAYSAIELPPLPPGVPSHTCDWMDGSGFDTCKHPSHKEN